MNSFRNTGTDWPVKHTGTNAKMKKGSPEASSTEREDGRTEPEPNLPLNEAVDSSSGSLGLRAVKVYDPEIRFISLTNSLNVRAAGGLKLG